MAPAAGVEMAGGGVHEEQTSWHCWRASSMRPVGAVPGCATASIGNRGGADERIETSSCGAAAGGSKEEAGREDERDERREESSSTWACNAPRCASEDSNIRAKSLH